MDDVSIGLLLYEISVQSSDKTSIASDWRKRDDYDLKENIKLFINDSLKEKIYGEKQKTYSFDLKEEGDYLAGYVRYGTYGVDSNLVDIDRSEVVHVRKQNHAEITELYYCLFFSPEHPHPFLALQTYKQFSCATLVQESMRKYLKDKHSDYRLNFQKISLGGFNDCLLKNIELVKNRGETGINEWDEHARNSSVATSFNVRQTVNLTFKEKFKFGELFRKVKRKNKDGHDIIIHDEYEYETAFATIETGSKKRKRKIALIGASSRSGKIDLTDENLPYREGKIDFNSMHKHTKDIFDDLIK